jgi:hypothetical protein
MTTLIVPLDELLPVPLLLLPPQPAASATAATPAAATADLAQ